MGGDLVDRGVPERPAQGVDLGRAGRVEEESDAETVPAGQGEPLFGALG
ncbi:MAG: hypothetical protein ACRDZX_12490 [Acidimicrobiales bacterium]